MLKTGAIVVVHTCSEAEHYEGKLWKCRTDEFTSTSLSEVVFLEDFSGYFLTDYLQKVDISPLTKELDRLYSERYKELI